jgi:hypothetical protein
MAGCSVPLPPNFAGVDTNKSIPSAVASFAVVTVNPSSALVRNLFIVCVHIVAYCILLSIKILLRVLCFTTPGKALDSDALNFPAHKMALYNFFSVQRYHVSV